MFNLKDIVKFSSICFVATNLQVTLREFKITNITVQREIINIFLLSIRKFLKVPLRIGCITLKIEGKVPLKMLKR